MAGYGGGSPGLKSRLSDDDDEEMQQAAVSPSGKERSRRRVHGARREEHTFVYNGANKQCLSILLATTLMGFIVVVAVGVVREVVWNAHMQSVKSHANMVVSNAALIAQRAHHGGDKLTGDIKALANLVKIELEIDATAAEATSHVASASSAASQRVAAKEEKSILGTKLLGVEPAITTVVHAIEKDIALAEGHPLLLGADGVPLSSAGATVGALAGELKAAADLVDAGLRDSEQDAEALTQVKKDADEEENTEVIQERIKDRAENIKNLEKLETKLVAAISTVADDVTERAREEHSTSAEHSTSKDQHSTHAEYWARAKA